MSKLKEKILSLLDEMKMKALTLISDDFIKTNIINTLESDEKKIEALALISDDFDKKNIINTLKSDEKKIEALALISSDFCKVQIIVTLKSDEKKIEALTLISDDFTKMNIINTLESDEKKIEALALISNRFAKREAINTLESDEKKIEALALISSFHEREKIISTLKSDEKKIEALSLISSFLDQKKIISTLKSDEKKIEALALISDNHPKKQIIKIIETFDDNIKLKAIKIIQDDGKKADVAKTIADDNIKLEAIKIIQDDGKKADVAKTINDDNIKLKIIKEYIQDNDAKINVINTFSDDNTVIDLKLKLYGFLEDEIPGKKKLIIEMSKKNEEVIRNLNYNLLKNKYIEKLGFDKINTISCFTNIQEDILDLSDVQFDIFFKCIDNFIKDAKTEEWSTIACEILDSLKSNEYAELISNIENIYDINIDILGKVLQNTNVFEIKTLEDLNNYETIKKKKTDEWIKSANLEQKKLAVFEKIFGHDAKYASKILESYAEDIDSIEECDIKYYVKSIKAIQECDSEEILERMYNECRYITFVDKALVEKSLKREYLKLYNKNLLKVEDTHPIDGEDNMYLAGTDFKMIITSIGAYINADSRNSNYREDWNRPSLASQHFCTSYIRNDMLGTAPISNICYGFDIMSEDSLMLSGPIDIYSSGAKELEVTGNVEKYYNPDNQINHTDDYNEMDFRRIQNGKKKQPSYIVVFKKNGKIDNLDNAKKAQKDWGGKLPIIVVDVDACLESEKNKVHSMIEEYETNKNPELAKQIYYKIRNNRVANPSFCENIDIDEYYNSNERLDKHDNQPNVTEADLEENFKSITSEERQAEIGKMKQIFLKHQQIIEQEETNYVR